MDEPFSALDVQTRQLMENELLELWSADRKSVVFITHDLEEAIALSDRVVVLSAGPETHPIGEFAIDLPRPRDVAEIRLTPRFIELAHADLARDEGRGAEGLCPAAAAMAGSGRRSLPDRERCVCTRRCCSCWCSSVWYVLTSPTLLPPIYFDDANKAAFFFGEPQKVLGRICGTGSRRGEIYRHLWVTLIETLLAFAIGTVLRRDRSGSGSPSRRSPRPSSTRTSRASTRCRGSSWRRSSSCGSASGSHRRWRLGVTLVFFIVFFNVYQGVREVSPVVLANARMLGASPRQLLRYVYLPSAMSWVFASLHNSVGLAFVGAVVGEYLGSAEGVGYLILQAEGVFDINTVFAGILLLTGVRAGPGLDRGLAREAADGLAAAGGETERVSARDRLRARSRSVLAVLFVDVVLQFDRLDAHAAHEGVHRPHDGAHDAVNHPGMLLEHFLQVMPVEAEDLGRAGRAQGRVVRRLVDERELCRPGRLR